MPKSHAISNDRDSDIRHSTYKDIELEVSTRPIRVGDFARSLLKVGLIGFGGGIGMLALLRHECVQRKKYITDDDLCTGVAIGQMLPGPFIPNYCEYIGYHLFGVRGSIVGAIALLTPSFLLMCILSYLYMMYQTLPGVTQVFHGIGAVITAIVLWASYDMGKVLIKDSKGVIIFVCACALFLLKFDPILTVLICGVFRIVLDRMPAHHSMLLAVPLFVFDWRTAAELAWVFLKIGAIIFGGGYGAIPFIKNDVCTVYGWLTPREFIDGFALGQMTPGPVAITATFVGFKVMGLPGALIASICIFLPSLIMLLILVRVYQRIRTNKYVLSFFSGITSAVVAILLTTGILFVSLNWLSIPYGIFGAAVLIIMLFKRIEPALLILAGAVFGLIIG
jgi:chromate transporter